MPWELLYVVIRISNDFLFSKEINKIHNKVFFYYSEEQISITTKEFIQRELADKIREIKIDSSQINRAVLESFNTDIVVCPLILVVCF